MADESQFGKKQGPTSGSAMRCEEWEGLLTDALDGLLPAAQAAAFHNHAETCENCGDLFAHVKRGQEWLAYLHEEPDIPAGLVGRIVEKTLGPGSVPLPVVVAGAGAGTGVVAAAMPWRRSFHETRLLMTVAMAFFSLALTLNLVTGGHLTTLRLADLKPSQIGSTISREFYGARSSVVRYYDNVRFFYQLQSRMRELRRDVQTQPQQQQQNQQNQQQQKPAGKGGSATAVPERGGVLNASQSSRPKSIISRQTTEEGSKTAVVLVSETGKSISLDPSEAGLRRENVERGLV